MACDSRVTVGDVTHPGQKVWVMPGMIIGVCGEGRSMTTVLRWLLEGQPKTLPEATKGSFGALILTRDGLFTCDESCFVEPVKRAFHAVGQGAGPAIAAMLCGKGAAEAVEIACQVDSATGGPVRVYRLSDAPRATPKRQRKV
jgi:hypothetical protein